jgi:hypothetical protein
MHNSSVDGIDMKSDDLITRLEEAGRVGSLCWEAADEIERLRAEVARLGTFLHPVGMVINTYGTSPTITESQMQKLKEEPS